MRRKTAAQQCCIKSLHLTPFFEPRHLIIDGQNLRTIKFNRILDDQLTIAVLSKGAININDTNNMPVSDRQRLLKTLIDVEEKKAEEMRRLTEARKSK